MHVIYESKVIECIRVLWVYLGADTQVLHSIWVLLLLEIAQA